MKILHVDTARSWRGGQNQVLLSARGMRARGHAVAVACRRGGALAERFSAEPDIDVRPLPFRGDFSPAAMAGLRALAIELRPDVVHLHDPHAVAAALLVRGPRVVASRRVDFPLRGPLSRWKYSRCDAVLAVSRAAAAIAEAGGIPADRVRVVYEGVPDRAPQPGGREALAALGIAGDALVVGNVAALTSHKDHDTLVRAAGPVMERVPQAVFVIVGDGELREQVHTLADRLGLGGRVVFAGFRDDLDCLVPAFDIFCLSSVMEGLGTSLLDAMCFGRPVVGTAAGGIPEAVEDGVTGRIVATGNPVALADALVALLEDGELRRAMGAAGRERFLARFSADRMVEETLRAYEDTSVR